MAFLFRKQLLATATFDFQVGPQQAAWAGFVAPEPAPITGTFAFEVAGQEVAWDGTVAAIDAPEPHDFTPTQVATAQNTHVVNLPPNPEDIPFGAMVFIYGAFDGLNTVNTPAGWSIVSGVAGSFESTAPGGVTHRQNLFMRQVDTNWPLDTDTTVTVTMALGQRGAWGSFWVSSHALSSIGIIASSIGGRNPSPDPPARATVGGASMSVLALELSGIGGQDLVTDYESSGYTKLGKVSSGGSPGASIQVAYRQATVVSEDPLEMVLNSTQSWRASTVLIPFGTEGVELPPPSGEVADLVIGPTQSIQAALDSLSPGQLLGLLPGSYHESFVMRGGRRVRAEQGGTVVFSSANPGPRPTWSGSGGTWTLTAPNPGVVIVGRTVLIECPSSTLTRGYTYSGGVITLRTGGLNPNTEDTTIRARDYCIDVEPGGVWDPGPAHDKAAVKGIKFRGFRRIAIRRQGATPASSTSPAAPQNFYVEDCDFIGSWKAVDWGRETGSNNRTRWCAFSNYPIFRDSTRNAADSGSPSENSQWGAVYNTDFASGGLGSGDRNMSSVRFGGSGDKFHNNLCRDLFDSVQPRQGGSTTSMVMQEIYRNAFIYGRDDIEYDSFSSTLLHFFRHYHNFHVCCYVYLAMSVVARGPGHVDRNIFLEIPEPWPDGLARGTFFKGRNDEIARNNFIFHNTIRAAPKPSHGLFFQMGGTFINCWSINNIFSFSDGSVVALPAANGWTNVANLTGATPGFTDTAPYDFTPLPGSPAASGGNTSSAPSQFTGLLQSHRGALAPGEIWPLRADNGTDAGHTGPRWAPKIMSDLMTEFLIDGLPANVDPRDLGITV